MAETQPQLQPALLRLSAMISQMPQEGAHLIRSHFLMMTNVVKADEALDPIHISLPGARAVMVESSDRCPHSIKEFGRSRVGPKHSLPSCRALTQIASMPQETDCKVQSGYS